MAPYNAGDPGSYMELVGSTVVHTLSGTDETDLYFDMTEYEYCLVICTRITGTTALVITARDATSSAGAGAADFDPGTGVLTKTMMASSGTGLSGMFPIRLHGARQFIGFDVSGGTDQWVFQMIGIRAANQRQVPGANDLSAVFTLS